MLIKSIPESKRNSIRKNSSKNKNNEKEENFDINSVCDEISHRKLNLLDNSKYININKSLNIIDKYNSRNKRLIDFNNNNNIIKNNKSSDNFNIKIENNNDLTGCCVSCT